MTRLEPTILERLQVGGLRPELVAEFRDRHRRRTPCRCALCSAANALGAIDTPDRAIGARQVTEVPPLPWPADSTQGGSNPQSGDVPVTPACFFGREFQE